MNATHVDALSRMARMCDDYVRLLDDMERVTDQLIEAASESDTQRVGSLLTERERVCSRFGPAASKLSRVMQDVRDLPDDPESADAAPLRTLKTAISDLIERHEAMLGKQATCERLFQGRIDECKSELMRLRRRSDLHVTYTLPHDAPCAKYVDSRL